MFEGLSNFADARAATGSPFPDHELWHRLLTEAGFEESKMLPAKDAPEDLFGQAVILAQKPIDAPTVTQMPDMNDLLEHLRKHLPEYMVPQNITAMARIPLTANGKLDAKSILEPQLAGASVSEFVAPEGEIEEALADLWARILNVERVGRHDNFFSLGGDSLTAISVCTEIRKSLDVQIEVGTFLAEPTLKALATLVETQFDELFDSMSDAQVQSALASQETQQE